MAASTGSTAAAVVKLPKIPPSSFSVLLRRSKFASYDPQIGQVYATYKGSAHRGDWGLKRPLSVRRRDGRLIISSIDTLYQQTEWTSAYSDTMAIRTFEEMRFTPQIGVREPWAARFKPDGSGSSGEYNTVRQRNWMHDSDYAEVGPEQTKFDLKANPPVPDPNTMKPKRFERYLRKLRRLGPEFHKYVTEKEKKKEKVAVPLPFHQCVGLGYPSQFLGAKFIESCEKDPNFIYPMPHPTGGLTYNNMNQLQSAIQAKPIEGRRIRYDRDTRNAYQGQSKVVLGGWVADEKVVIPVGEKDEDNVECPVSLVDFGTKEGEPRRDLEAGTGPFRPGQMESVVKNPPNVVGKYPERLSRGVVKLNVWSWSGVNEARRNPHKPGTRDYIGHDENSSQATALWRVQYKSKTIAEPETRFTMSSYKPREYERPTREPDSQQLINRLKGLTSTLRGRGLGQGVKES